MTEQNPSRQPDADRLLAALLAYHALAPALAECVNECGEAVLYSNLHVANEAAEAVLQARGELGWNRRTGRYDRR